MLWFDREHRTKSGVDKSCPVLVFEGSSGLQTVIMQLQSAL